MRCDIQSQGQTKQAQERSEMLLLLRVSQTEAQSACLSLLLIAGSLEAARSITVGAEAVAKEKSGEWLRVDAMRCDAMHRRNTAVNRKMKTMTYRISNTDEVFDFNCSRSHGGHHGQRDGGGLILLRRARHDYSGGKFGG